MSISMLTKPRIQIPSGIRRSALAVDVVISIQRKPAIPA
jgi:hypothetical protein